MSETKHVKFSLRIDVAKDANYSSIEQSFVPPALEIAAGAVERYRLNVPITTGVTIKLDALGITDTNVRAIYLVNKDATNFVTLSYATAGDANLRAHKVFAGGWHLLQDVDFASSDVRAPTIVADTAACECELIVVSL